MIEIWGVFVGLGSNPPETTLQVRAYYI